MNRVTTNSGFQISDRSFGDYAARTTGVRGCYFGLAPSRKPANNSYRLVSAHHNALSRNLKSGVVCGELRCNWDAVF
jgi:hypothetical protein